MSVFFSLLLVLGPLIFVHELGHFAFAKLFGVRVLKFSLGFGPKMVGKVVGETEYVISVFPLGGFVKMFGENIDERDIEDDERERSFVHKPVWQRFFIVLAGPLFNLCFAVVLFFMVFATVGIPIPTDTTRIGEVNKGSAAEQAGLMAGDVIISINDWEVKGWLDVIGRVKENGGQQLSMEVLRGADRISVEMSPKMDVVKDEFGKVVERRFMVGIIRDENLRYKEIGPLESFKEAFMQSWMYVDRTVVAFKKMLQREISASELGGPILIAQLAEQQMRAGWLHLVYFIALLSVNLGILNLLPIPVLDGGHLVFLAIEGVWRKPLNERVQIIAQQVGMGMLATLMLIVFYNDIIRTFK